MTTRRQLLSAIGMIGGATALYQAMTTLGHAAETQFAGPPNLSGARKGASVIVLGAGLAGMVAAYELSKAGYQVRILEYQPRAGGRNWSLYGGDPESRLCAGQLPEPRPLAHPSPPPHLASLLQGVRRAA
jgi:monoamine oxidase